MNETFEMPQERGADQGVPAPDTDWVLELTDAELARRVYDNLQEAKNCINACAEAFARTRDSWAGSLSREDIAARSKDDLNLWRAFRLARALLVEMPDGRFRYFNCFLDPRHFKIEELLSMLQHYQPEKGRFMTYLDHVMKHRSNETVSASVPIDDLPEGLLQEEPERLDVLLTWGAFAEFILEVTLLKKSIQGHRTTHYAAYMTRDYLLQVCESYKGEYGAVGLISRQVDRALDQPYILYMRAEAIQNEAQAREYIRIKAPRPVYAEGLMRLYNRPFRDPQTHQGSGLIEERYRYQKVFNRYFGKANLNQDFSRYESGRKAFFMRELPR